ncbi:MAG: LysR family transcriptional regulator [Aristaeellaceae bacterium]
MILDYICEFAVLAETCNYMEAADQLFISQSALSRHIKTLEEDLGVQLFTRTTRRVALSSFGSLFLPYAQRMSALRSDYENAISMAKNAERGNIRLGTIPVMAQYEITDVIVCFQKENPLISLDIVEGDTNELIRELRSGQIHMAFVREGEGEEDSGEFNKIHYDTDQLTAFLSRQHPFAERQFIRVEHLRNEPLMLLSKDTYMHTLCVQACRKAGFEPNIVLTSHRGRNMLELARKNMGIALLTKRPTLPMLTEDLVAVDIEPRIITNINLIYPKNQKLSPGAQRFVSTMLKIRMEKHPGC